MAHHFWLDCVCLSLSLSLLHKWMSKIGFTVLKNQRIETTECGHCTFPVSPKSMQADWYSMVDCLFGFPFWPPVAFLWVFFDSPSMLLCFFRFSVVFLWFSFCIALFFFCFQSAQAQISFPDNVNDEAPAAPINGLIALGLVAGAALGLKKTNKDL